VTASRRLDAPADTADDCTGCGARAGSCDVRKWLAGRPCCETCDHEPDHVQEGG